MLQNLSTTLSEDLPSTEWLLHTHWCPCPEFPFLLLLSSYDNLLSLFYLCSKSIIFSLRNGSGPSWLVSGLKTGCVYWAIDLGAIDWECVGDRL